MLLPPEIAAKKARVAELDAERTSLLDEIMAWRRGVDSELADVIAFDAAHRPAVPPELAGAPDKQATRKPRANTSQYRLVVNKVTELGRVVTSEQVFRALARDGHEISGSAIRHYLPSAVNRKELRKVSRGRYGPLSTQKDTSP